MHDRCAYFKVSFSIFQGNSGKFAKLNMSSLKYTGAVDLTQYFVKSYSFSDIDEGVQVDFIFSRRLLNQILTVFMPTVVYNHRSSVRKSA